MGCSFRGGKGGTSAPLLSRGGTSSPRASTTHALHSPSPLASSRDPALYMQCPPQNLKLRPIDLGTYTPLQRLHTLDLHLGIRRRQLRKGLVLLRLPIRTGSSGRRSARGLGPSGLTTEEEGARCWGELELFTAVRARDVTLLQLEPFVITSST